MHETVGAGTDTLQRDLNLVTILQPKLGLAAHAHSLGTV